MKVFGKNSLKEALNDPKKIKKVYLTNNFKDKDIINLIKKDLVVPQGANQSRTWKIQE